MATEKFDTFISYRRSSGSVFASRIHDNLMLKGFAPFYDITEMQTGRFDEQLEECIVNSSNFILVLSEGALDRCIDNDDWVKKEVTYAKHR